MLITSEEMVQTMAERSPDKGSGRVRPRFHLFHILGFFVTVLHGYALQSTAL